MRSLLSKQGVLLALHLKRKGKSDEEIQEAVDEHFGDGVKPLFEWRIAAQRYRSDGFRNDSWLGRDDTNGRDELTARAKWRWRGPNGSTSPRAASSRR